jgi:hypothetical protein
VNKEASHYERLFGGNKIENLIFPNNNNNVSSDMVRGVDTTHPSTILYRLLLN